VNVDEARSNLIENIERQRLGFRNLGSTFYDRLGHELERNILESGPVWTVLASFASAPFGDAYALRFLAGIHKLVLEGSAPNIAAHFPSEGGDGDAAAAMRAIVDLLEVSPGAVQAALAVPPQTNEVGRAPALASGLLFIARQFGLPLRLREIGSSGGLNLRLDSYWYEQGGQGWGTRESPLRFVDLWIDGIPPFSHGAEILDRRGCDRRPIDVTSPTGALTLLSYVWPEPRERLVRLRQAIEVARRTPAAIDEADAATWVPHELAGRTQGTVMVIMHSVVWQYLDPETVEAITGAMVEAGAGAKPDSPLAWLRLEPNPETYTPAELRVTLWDGSEPRDHLLATTGFHGGPITWQNDGG
jgi:hypothetical protein